MVVGGITILYGAYKGSKKGSKKFTYQEQLNKLKMDELNIEMEKLKLLYELDELEEEEEKEKEKESKKL